MILILILETNINFMLHVFETHRDNERSAAGCCLHLMNNLTGICRSFIYFLFVDALLSKMGGGGESGKRQLQTSAVISVILFWWLILLLFNFHRILVVVTLRHVVTCRPCVGLQSQSPPSYVAFQVEHRTCRLFCPAVVECEQKPLVLHGSLYITSCIATAPRYFKDEQNILLAYATPSCAWREREREREEREREREGGRESERERSGRYT